METQNSELKLRLKAAGYSNTDSRQIVFDALKLHGPLTMNELVKTCLKKTDRATVYRVIKLFEELGIVQRIQLGWKYKVELSEQFTHHHHHLTCLGCSKIIDIDIPHNFEADINELAKSYGFKVKTHQLDVSGYCSDCLKKGSGKSFPDL